MMDIPDPDLVPVPQSSSSQPNSAHLPPLQPQFVFFQPSDPVSSSSRAVASPPDLHAVEKGLSLNSLAAVEQNPMPHEPLGLPFVAAGGSRMAHLPTPQSPTTFPAPYVNGASASPSLPPSQRRLAAAQNNSLSDAPRGMLTPDSSPMVARRWGAVPGGTETTPTKRRRTPPPSAPKTPPPAAGTSYVPTSRTPPSGNGLLTESHSSIKTESPSTSQSIQAQTPPRPSASAQSQSSRLSSPFTPTHRPPSSSQPPPPDSLSPTQPPPSPLPDSAADTEVDARAPGGEIARIRAEHARRKAEAEARRPEYLVRLKRPHEPADADAAVGVTESPAKGRRLALWGFAETSEESFEERLMAGGYGGYGSTAPVETPVAAWTRRAEDAASPEAGGVGEGEVVDGKEARKRRRLEAFRRGGNAVVGRVSTLRPVEVEGKGRMLLDVGKEEVGELVGGFKAEGQPSASTRGKRGGRRRRRGGRAARGTAKDEGVAGTTLEGDTSKEEANTLNWPDAEFPWCVRTMERKETERMEEAERMKWIERFLEGESEDSNEEEEDVEMQLGAGQEEYAVREGAVWWKPGRGKMVPLRDYNDPSSSARIAFPSDPADARAALLSKREVRQLAYKRQLGMDLGAELDAEPDEEEVVCICRGRDDGRELVQCDGCRTWYHLECIGIEDVAELGREEDPWYCQWCLSTRDEQMRLEETQSEPTFVTDEGPTPHRPHDPLFYQGAMQQSPLGAWDAPGSPRRTHAMPTTPTRRARAENLSSSRSQGPVTPQHPSAGAPVRVHASPEYAYTYAQDGSPFDPTSTPSRGFRFGAPFTTPKAGPWAGRPIPASSGPFLTPGNLNARHVFARRESAGAGGMYDDTPVDRVGGAAEGPQVMPARKLMDSPLMGRAVARRAGVESPVTGGKGKGKGKGTVMES